MALFVLGVTALGFVEFRLPQLTDRAQAALRGLAPGTEVDAGQVTVQLVPWRAEAQVRLDDVTLTFAADPVQIDQARVRLPLSGLVRGRVAPSEVQVSGVRLPLNLSPALAEALPAPDSLGQPPDDELAARLARAIFESDLLNRIAALELLERLRGFRMDRVQLDLRVADRSETLLTLTLDTAQMAGQAGRPRQIAVAGWVRPPGAGETGFALEGSYDPKRRLALRFASEAVTPAAYATTLQVLGLEVPHLLTTPYRFGLTLTLDRDQQSHEAGLEVHEVRGAQAHRILALTATADLQGQSLAVTAGFDQLDLRRLAPWTPVPDIVDQLALTTRGSATVRWHLPTDDWRADFTLASGTGTLTIPQIGLPSAPDVAVGVRDMRATGQFDARGLALTDMELATGSRDQAGPVLNADLFIRTTADQPTMTLDLRSAALNQGDLFFLWPTSVAPKARSDVARFVTAGAFTDLSFKGVYAFETGDDGALNFALQGQQLRADFSAADVKFTPGLPAITRAQGALTFAAGELQVAFDTAQFESLDLEAGLVRVDLRTPGNVTVAVETQLAGAVAPTLGTLAGGGVGLARLADLPLDRLSGTVQGDLAMQLTFDSATQGGEGIAQDDLVLEAALNVRDLRIGDFLVGQDVADGALDFTITQTGLRATGTARLGQIPAEVALSQSYIADQEGRLALEIWADLPADQAGLFLPGVQNFLGGQADTQVRYERIGDRPAQAYVQMDLRDMALSFPALVYEKPVGEGGSVAFDVLFDEARPQTVSDLRLRGPDLSADAEIQMVTGPGAGDWATIQLRDVRAGVMTFATLQLQRRDGVIRATGRGGDLDMEALLDQFTRAQAARLEGEGGQGAFGFRVGQVFLMEDAQIDRLDFGGATALEDARFSLVVADEGLRGYTLNAAVPANEANVPGGRMDSRLVQRDGVYTLSLHADNFGALLETLHMSGDVRGGRLALTGTSIFPVGGGPWDLEGTVTNFRLAEVPSLLNLVSLVSLTGVAEQMSGQGLGFDELEFRGRMDVPRLQIRDLRLAGPSIGLLVSGRLNWATRYVQLRGALAPFNVVNQIFQDIPVLAELVTGSDGQGIFASQFEIFGPFDTLDVRVDPFSILQPGIMRSVIDDIEPEAF